MPFDEDRHIDQLVSVYRQGFEEILRTIVRKEAKGQWTKYWRDLLLDVRDVLRGLDSFADEWIEAVVGQVYSQAVAETVAFLQGLGARAPEKPEFAQVHQRAVDVVAQNTADNLRSATQFIGRRVNDVFRQVGLEATAGKLGAGATVRDMKREVVRRLLDQGQTAFVDRLGRKWRLDRYAEMVARTTTREASSVAVLNECAEFGLDLVRITVHYPTCEKCAPLQGKVFSISGRDRRYPRL
ncbi:MAG: phage minor capsid protein, partial [Firmicutes bacterium]|nr:phage minor capsid protein [Bacillota bacterium]